MTAPAEKVSACKSCGAPITWSRTRLGKLAPYDLDGTNHFSTCPSSNRHRGKPATADQLRAAREARQRPAETPAPIAPAVVPTPTPTPTEPVGAVALVVSAPIGPRCTVLTDDLLLVRGHRVPDDYAGPETVHRGRCVAVHVETRAGTVVLDADGRLLPQSAEGGGWTWNRIDADGSDRRIVRLAAPPPLRRT